MLGSRQLLADRGSQTPMQVVETIKPETAIFLFPLTLATWNFRTLLDNPRRNRQEQRTALVARELACHKVDIAALSETRFSEQGQLEELSPREIRHLDCISQFTSDIRHIDGSRNEVADALSRPSIAHLQLSPGIDLAEMVAEQRRLGSPCDEDVSGLQLQELPLTTGNGTILCDVFTPSHRPFVPPSLRRKVFSSLHNLSHPGSRATDRLVSDRFVWPGMHKDLKAWTRACLGCQRSKIQRHNKAPIGTFPGSGVRFSHVHLDSVGPLPLSNGCSYLLTCVDRFTRWPEAIPLPDIAAPTVVKAFLSRWVAIFGAPSTITTDRGAQFESHLFQSLLSFLGCTRIRTTAYHPAANGMVERFHRQLKASLRAAADPENWTDHLPLVLLGIRSALKPDLDCSAAELVFGATVRLPGQMISPTPRVAVEDPTNLLHRLRQFLRTLSPVPPRSSASPSYLEKDLATCSHVYLRCDRVRRPLEPPYDGPFRVISRGTKKFRIQRGTREEIVSVNRLKAAVPDTPPDEPCGPLPPAPPPRPSIPPSRILPLPPCPQPTTATTPSSTSSTSGIDGSVFSVRYSATFGLAGGYCGSLRLLALCIRHAAFLSASHSLSIRCWYARGLSLASRVLEANRRCPLSDWLADAETTEGAHTRWDTTPRRRTQTTACCGALAATAYRALVPQMTQQVEDPPAADKDTFGTPSIRPFWLFSAANAANTRTGFDDNDAVTSNLLAEKNRLRRAYLDRPTDEIKAAFYQCRRPAQQRLGEMQNAWMARKVEEIQGYADCNDSRNFFALRPRRILKRWAKHFRTVLNRPSTTSDAVIDRLLEVEINVNLGLPPSLLETIHAVQQLSSGRAPGSDVIPAEIYKHGGHRLMDQLTSLFYKIWLHGQFPQDFKDAAIVTVKGTGRSSTISEAPRYSTSPGRFSSTFTSIVTMVVLRKDFYRKVSVDSGQTARPPT
ncbi:hypothetical protein SprV_0702345100 [Sparganum proliferum]